MISITLVAVSGKWCEQYAYIADPLENVLEQSNIPKPSARPAAAEVQADEACVTAGRLSSMTGWNSSHQASMTQCRFIL
jgi:hypothetical protein